MFLEFYNLREMPFGVTPDPRFLYFGPTHREALASLIYGLKSRRGFMTLIAPPGMGKTSLLFCLLEHFRHSARTAFVFRTQCDAHALLRHLLADLGLNGSSQDIVEMHQQLNQLLVREAQSGRQAIVVIDEAQNLDDQALESVRLLSNFETPQAKLIQVVMAGQPPLADKLLNPGLVQLRQRVSIMTRLEPFSSAEVNHYINHRLWVAGYNGGDLFTPEARLLIAELSEGIPRNINNLCFNSLSIGCALRKKAIDGAAVREAAADLDIRTPGPDGPGPDGFPAGRAAGPPPAETRYSPVGAPSSRGMRFSKPSVTPLGSASPDPVETSAPATCASSERSASFAPEDSHEAALSSGLRYAPPPTALPHAPSVKPPAADCYSMAKEAPPRVPVAGRSRWRRLLLRAGTAGSLLLVLTLIPIPVLRDWSVASATLRAAQSLFAGTDSSKKNRALPLGGLAARAARSSAPAPPSASAIQVVVKHDDNLTKIGEQYLGNYDDEVAARIRKLNPQLTNLDLIQVGQRILLPSQRRMQVRAQTDTQEVAPGSGVRKDFQ